MKQFDFKIEDRSGIPVVFGTFDDGSQWCHPASSVEVALWDALHDASQQPNAVDGLPLCERCGHPAKEHSTFSSRCPGYIVPATTD